MILISFTLLSFPQSYLALMICLLSFSPSESEKFKISRLTLKLFLLLSSPSPNWRLASVHGLFEPLGHVGVYPIASIIRHGVTLHNFVDVLGSASTATASVVVEAVTLRKACWTLLLSQRLQEVFQYTSVNFHQNKVVTSCLYIMKTTTLSLSK